MEIQKTNFGPNRFVIVKKEISTDQITDQEMYHAAFDKLGAFFEKTGTRPSGPPAVLYFLWDEANLQAVIGVGFPVEGLAFIDNAELALIDIPQAKAAAGILHGSLEGLGEAHRELMKYFSENKLESAKPVFAVEEYATGRMDTPESENWITNIYYLYN